VAPSGTLAVIADLKRASSEFFSAASFTGYGVSSFVGIGVAIPVLDEDIAAQLALTDDDLTATIYDYGIPKRETPSLGRVTYAQLRSGEIEIQGKQVPCGPISSFPKARRIAATLKSWIVDDRFALTQPLEALPGPGSQSVGPLEVRGEEEI